MGPGCGQTTATTATTDTRIALPTPIIAALRFWARLASTVRIEAVLRFGSRPPSGPEAAPPARPSAVLVDPVLLPPPVARATGSSCGGGGTPSKVAANVELFSSGVDVGSLITGVGVAWPAASIVVADGLPIRARPNGVVGVVGGVPVASFVATVDDGVNLWRPLPGVSRVGLGIALRLSSPARLTLTGPETSATSNSLTDGMVFSGRMGPEATPLESPPPRVTSLAPPRGMGPPTTVTSWPSDQNPLVGELSSRSTGTDPVGAEPPPSVDPTTGGGLGRAWASKAAYPPPGVVCTGRDGEGWVSTTTTATATAACDADGCGADEDDVGAVASANGTGAVVSPESTAAICCAGDAVAALDGLQPRESPREPSRSSGEIATAGVTESDGGTADFSSVSIGFKNFSP